MQQHDHLLKVLNIVQQSIYVVECEFCGTVIDLREENSCPSCELNILDNKEQQEEE